MPREWDGVPEGTSEDMVYKKDIVYEEILRRINRAYYPAQSFIDEQTLARELNTSRTPIREALLALSKEGYVSILPKRGIIVLPFTYQDAMDVFQTRALLEPWLITTYGPELTREELEAEYPLIRAEIEAYPENRAYPGVSIKHHPHILLMNKCTNEIVRNILDDMERQAERLPNERPVNKVYGKGIEKPAMIKAHTDLVDLMIEGDFEGAAQMMVEHVKNGQDEYMNFWFG